AVHGDDIICVLGRDARERAGVAPEIPDQLPAPGRRRGAHEFQLPVELSFVVRMGAVVIRPFRLDRWQLQSRNKGSELVDIALDQTLVEPCTRKLVSYVHPLAGVALLKSALRRDMKQHAWPEEIAQGHQAIHVLGWYAVDTPPEPRPEVDAFVGDRKSTRLNSSHVKISY